MPRKIYDTRGLILSQSNLFVGMGILLYFVFGIYPEENFVVLGCGLFNSILGMVLAFRIHKPIVIDGVEG